LDNRDYLKCALVFFILFFMMAGFSSSSLFAQERSKSYEFIPFPDLWYNDVDGIRVGLTVRGQKPGTFGDGPHRLNFGIWLGTWIPDEPVSYYLTFTEPISSISDFGSEGNVQLFSSYRTGFQRHGISFNKRWQKGFNEQNFKEFSIRIKGQDRFNNEYLLFPALWQEDWLFLSELDFRIHSTNSLGQLTVFQSATVNVIGDHPSFIRSTTTIEQKIPMGESFGLNTRLFLGLASKNTAPEYLFTHSLKPAISWQDKGLTRAKGTIPVSWMESGIFQVSGGADLRGYTEQDIEFIDNGLPPLFTGIGAINVELDYPNPLNIAFKKIPFLGDLLEFRSYTFFDAGTSPGFTKAEEDRWLSDAGLGFMFSLNIPDNLGNPRGIVLRYDVPFWVSNPELNESSFKYRNLIGIGAIISL